VAPAPVSRSRPTNLSTAAAKDGICDRTAAANVASRSLSDPSMSRHSAKTVSSEVGVMVAMKSLAP